MHLKVMQPCTAARCRHAPKVIDPQTAAAGWDYSCVAPHEHAYSMDCVSRANVPYTAILEKDVDSLALTTCMFIEPVKARPRTFFVKRESSCVCPVILDNAA